MGLLSYMPKEKEIKRLKETMDAYTSDDNQHLYLWKKDDEYVGIVGLIVENGTAIIQHICVIPSYRGEGIAKEIVQQVTALNRYDNVQASEDVQPFFEKCVVCEK